MGQRIKTAIVAIPIALFLIKMGGLPFMLGVMVLAMAGFKELQDMLHKLNIQVYIGSGALGIFFMLLAAGLGFDEWLLPMITLFSLLVLLEGLALYARGNFPQIAGSPVSLWSISDCRLPILSCYGN